MKRPRFPSEAAVSGYAAPFSSGSRVPCSLGQLTDVSPRIKVGNGKMLPQQAEPDCGDDGPEHPWVRPANHGGCSTRGVGQASAASTPDCIVVRQKSIDSVFGQIDRDRFDRDANLEYLSRGPLSRRLDQQY